MKKFLVILGLALGITTIVNTNTAEAKVLTEKQAAKKVATACKKAYTTKKAVSVTFKIKGRCLSSNFHKKVAQAEWGKYAIGDYYGSNGHCNGNYCNYAVPSCEFPTYSLLWKGKNGVYTVKEKIYYSEVKVMYSNFPYWKKICDHLWKTTKDMSQVEKAAYVDYWLGTRLGYHLATSDGLGDIYKCATPKRIWKGTAYGQCEVRANCYAEFAKIAGVKHVATVYVPEINHLDNAVRFEDGRVFIFTLGMIREGKWIDEEAKEMIPRLKEWEESDGEDWSEAIKYWEAVLEACTGERTKEDQELIESCLYNDFVRTDEAYQDNLKSEVTWYGENKTEIFTTKQQEKGPIYSKFAW